MVITLKGASSSGNDADKKLRADFDAAAQAGKLRIANFNPATGIGRFDADFIPNGHRLAITVKAKYDFVDGAAKWTGNNEKLAFAGRVADLINENWSRQYTIACSRPGWTDVYADVDFRVLSVDGGEHMDFRVPKLMPGETAGGGLLTKPGGFTLLLSSVVCEETTDLKYKEQIFAFKAQQAKEALSVHGGFVPFAPNSAEITAPVATKLLTLSQALARIIDAGMGDALKLYVYGSTGAGDRTLQMGLGTKRGEAVANFLRVKLGPSLTDFVKPVTSTAMHNWIPAEMKAIGARQKPPFAGTNAAGACLFLHTPKKEVDKQSYDSKYIVVLHEFGHVIGLPDEYMGIHDSGIANQANMATLIPSTVSKSVIAAPSERIAKQQNMMSDAMKTTGTNSPIFVDTKNIGLATSSIMAAGREILPAHYLTVWSALAQMTSKWIHPTEWKIVPKHTGQMKHLG